MKKPDDRVVVLCGRLKNETPEMAAMFPDNIRTDRCSRCRELVIHRPHSPRGVALVCDLCLPLSEVPLPALDVTPETAAEIHALGLLKRRPN